MRGLIILISIAVIAQAQNFPCGFSCSRSVQIQTTIDGAPGIASCNDALSPDRCNGCCKAKALQSGLTTPSASSFISSDNRNCVCCINNNSRNCNVVVFGK